GHHRGVRDGRDGGHLDRRPRLLRALLHPRPRGIGDPARRERVLDLRAPCGDLDCELQLGRPGGLHERAASPRLPNVPSGMGARYRGGRPLPDDSVGAASPGSFFLRRFARRIRRIPTIAAMATSRPIHGSRSAPPWAAGTVTGALVALPRCPCGSVTSRWKVTVCPAAPAGTVQSNEVAPRTPSTRVTVPEARV